MLHLLEFINLRVNKYKYYYNTKLGTINLLNPINIYLFYNRFIKSSLLKLYKSLNNLLRVKVYNNLIRYSYSKPKKYINLLYVKISNALIGGVIITLLYIRRKLYMWVIYLNYLREQSKVNDSEASNTNNLQLGKY